MNLTLTVADDCPTCENANSIDMSISAYHALGGSTEKGIFHSAFSVIFSLASVLTVVIHSRMEVYGLGLDSLISMRYWLYVDVWSRETCRPRLAVI
jgi:hypothetical protein